MQKYISKTDKKEIRYYDDGVDVGKYINLDNYRLMTDEEIDHHENPLKYLTDEELEQHNREGLSDITKVQLQLALLNRDELDDFEDALDNIEDSKTRRKMQIQYHSGDNFQRISEFTQVMIDETGYLDKDLDELWQEALEIQN